MTANRLLDDESDDAAAANTLRASTATRRSVSTGTTWEALSGYARAVRIGPLICVSGTTATADDGTVVGADAATQARFALRKIERALAQLGASLDDVIRTRVYVRRIEDWEAAARAHGEVFSAILPANTLVQAELVGDDYLVEIEADAWVDAP
jgi:enamine deaminase RidA (YjgF/YER057c/UK114 family)